MAGKHYKPPSDPRGGHARLYWDVLDSNAWRCLGPNDQRAYVALLRGLRSTNNGDLSLAFSAAKQVGIKSQTTLAASLRALCAVGLLAVSRKGGRTKGGQGLPTLYRLTDYPAFANPMKFIEASPATNEWKSVTTLGLGREAIRQAEAIAAQQAAEEKTKRLLQKVEGTTPENGVVTPKSTPESGVWPSTPLQKLEKAVNGKRAAKPTTARVSA